MNTKLASIRKRLWHVKRFLKILPSAVLGDLVMVTGVPRSGSTLIYNIVRLLKAQNSRRKCRANWINDFEFRPKIGEQVVLKTHDYDLMISWLPGTFIHSTRNLLEVASSTAKKNGEVPELQKIKIFRDWDLNWRKRADVFVEFVEVKDVRKLIDRLAHGLKIEAYEEETIIKELDCITKSKVDGEYDAQTLLQSGHVSGAGKQWKELLPSQLQKEIQMLQDV